MSLTNSTAATQASSSTHTVTLGFTPTAGRLLVVTNMTGSGAVTVVTAPTGWSVGPQTVNAGGTFNAVIYYKISDGLEVAAAVVWSGNTVGSMWVGEWDDTIAGGFNTSAEDEANIASAVTSQSTGTATATGAGLSIAVFGGDVRDNVTDGRSYSNSFSEQAFAVVSQGGRPSIHIATLSHAGAGSVECTFATTDTGDEMYGAVLCWLSGAAAAPAKKYRTLMGVGA